MAERHREFLTGRERAILRECVRHLAEQRITVPAGGQEPFAQQEVNDLLGLLQDSHVLLVSMPEEKLFSVPCRLTVSGATEEIAAMRARAFLCQAFEECNEGSEVVWHEVATRQPAG